MFTRLKFASLILSILFTVECAASDETYAIVSIGSANRDASYSQREVEKALEPMGFSSLESSMDETSGAFKLGVGIKMNKYLSVEANYALLGLYTDKLEATGPTVHETVKSTIQGFGVDAILNLPVSTSFQAYVRAGVVRSMSSYEATATGSSGSARASGSDSSTDTKFGFGVNVNVNDRVSIRLEREKYDLDDPISISSAGLTIKI